MAPEQRSNEGPGTKTSRLVPAKQRGGWPDWEKTRGFSALQRPKKKRVYKFNRFFGECIDSCIILHV